MIEISLVFYYLFLYWEKIRVMFVEVLPQVAETFKAPENSQFLTHDRKATGAGWGSLEVESELLMRKMHQIRNASSDRNFLLTAERLLIPICSQVTTINVIFFWRELAQFMFFKKEKFNNNQTNQTYILGLNLSLLRYHCQRISFNALKSAKFDF